jgi:uncharacterized membrane protein YbhN (UPF0104 family)
LSGNQTSERRRVIRLVGFAAVVGFAVYVLLPQVAELGDAVSALREGRWRYLAVALAGAALTYVAGGWAVSASIRLKLSFPRTLMAQLAASLMAFITPAGLGWVAVIDSYLRKAGADDHTAHTATTLTMIITFLSHIGLLAAAIPLLPTLRLPSIQLPSAHVVAEVVVAVLVLAGVAFWIPASRRRILKELVDMAQAIPAVLGDPKRSIVMVLAAVAVNLAFAVALIGSIAAYSPVPSLLGVLVAYMVSATRGRRRSCSSGSPHLPRGHLLAPHARGRLGTETGAKRILAMSQEDGASPCRSAAVQRHVLPGRLFTEA